MKHSTLLFAAAAATLFGPHALGRGNDEYSADAWSGRLPGAWVATVTPLDCATGAQIQPPFRALVAFHVGGTVSEAAGPPALRTASVGTWWRTGRLQYTATSVFLRYDAAGVLTGSQEIRRTIRLAHDGSTFVADTRFSNRNADGVTTFEGCARGNARRIE